MAEEKFGVREGLMAFAGLAALIGFGVRLSGCDEGSVGGSQEKNPARETIAATANEIYDDFSNNKIAADQKYGGKTVIVGGFFGHPDKHYDGDYSFRLSIVATGYAGRPAISEYQYVKAYAPQGEGQRLSAVQRGDLVLATCDHYVTSEDTFSDPQLKNCRDIRILSSGMNGILEYLKILSGERQLVTGTSDTEVISQRGVKSDSSNGSTPVQGGRDITVGSKISCNWKGLGTFYPGTVTSRDGDNISVKYDDGDFERTTIRCIKGIG